MLSSQSQFARACRALCTAAAMCLLPQGAAWADEYNLTLDPPEGFIIRDVPLLVTATVTPAPPQGYVEFVVGDLNSNPDVRRPLLDNKGRACTQINQADLDKYWSDTWGWNYVWAEYGYDQGAEFAGQMVRYYYDPTRPEQKARAWVRTALWNPGSTSP